MNNIFESVDESIFSLPKSGESVRAITRAATFSGLIFVPMIFFISGQFVETKLGISMTEFFVIFTAAYMLVFIFVTGRASSASEKLRGKLEKKLPRDVVIVAPFVSKNINSEVLILGQKYWFWQIISNYFGGLAFSWLACLFYFFVI